MNNVVALFPRAAGLPRPCATFLPHRLAGCPGYHPSPRAKWVAEETARTTAADEARASAIRAWARDARHRAEVEAQAIAAHQRGEPVDYDALLEAQVIPPSRDRMGSAVAFALAVLALMLAAVVGAVAWEVITGLPARAAEARITAEALSCGAC